VKYAIALGGANEYVTAGIPHAWLVSPTGEIVWEGSPFELKDAKIEEHLAGVSLLPTFSLPKELRASEKDLNAGKYGAGVKALETYLKKPKSTEAEAAAKEAIQKVKAYGDSELTRADEYSKAGDYAGAVETLQAVEKGFKGLEHSDKAKATLDAWKKDKTIKVELEGAEILRKAEALIKAKQYKNARQLLLQIGKSKKYEGTKAREMADKKYTSILNYP